MFVNILYVSTISRLCRRHSSVDKVGNFKYRIPIYQSQLVRVCLLSGFNSVIF